LDFGYWCSLELDDWFFDYFACSYSNKPTPISNFQSTNSQFGDWILVIGVHWSWMIGFLIILPVHTPISQLQYPISNQPIPNLAIGFWLLVFIGVG
jgi:hypothetical protein